MSGMLLLKKEFRFGKRDENHDCARFTRIKTFTTGREFSERMLNTQ
jgi:hypothetical protein